MWMKLEDVVEMMMKFFPESPCNYNDMDELSNCEWCDNNCGCSVYDCWEHAIKEKWYERMYLNEDT